MIFVIGLSYLIKENIDTKEQNKISLEQMEKAFESLYEELNLEINNYKIEETEGKIRLKINYETNIDEENKEELEKEKNYIYKEITKEKFLQKGLDRVWFLAKKDNKYILNRSKKIIKPGNKKFIQIAVRVYIFGMIGIGLTIKRYLFRRKRNKYLEGDELENYSLGELEMYVETNKNDDVAYYQIAELLREKKEFEKAKEYIKKARVLNYRSPEYKRLEGKIYYGLEDYKKAIAYYKGSEVVDTFFVDYDYYIGIGKAYIKIGKEEKGIKCLEKSKKIMKKQLKNEPKQLIKLEKVVNIIINETK